MIEKPTLRFEVKGNIIPYTRMTQRSKFYGRAQRYLKNKGDIQIQLAAQMARHGAYMIPLKVPLFVHMLFYHAKSYHGKDLDNQEKAILDAMSGIVMADDRWVDSIFSVRLPCTEDITIVLVTPRDGIRAWYMGREE